MTYAERIEKIVAALPEARVVHLDAPPAPKQWAIIQVVNGEGHYVGSALASRAEAEAEIKCMVARA